MRIYTTRRESEMIVQSLYLMMSTIPIDEMGEFKSLVDRILKVNQMQCPSDKGKYSKEGGR